MGRVSRPTTLSRSATLRLLRAITLLAPRLHEPRAAADTAALYTLVCDALRDVGLFAHIAQVEDDGQLHIVATSLEGPMVAVVEAMIGRPIIGYPFPAIGPVAEALASGQAQLIADLPSILQPILPHLDDGQRAELARAAQAERAILAPIVSGDAISGLLTVFGPASRLARDDAPAVAALGAQLGIALKNARLLRETDAEHARWRATVEAITEMVIVSDASHHLTYFNANAEQILGKLDPGLAPEDLATTFQLHRPDGDLYAVDDLPLGVALRTGEPSPPIPVLIRDAEGGDRRTVWIGSPIRDTAGTLLGAVAVGRDITRQHLLEEQNLAALATLLRVAALVTDTTAPADPATLLAHVAEALHGLTAVDFTHAMLVEEHFKPRALRMFGVSPEFEAEWRAGVAAFDPTASDRILELVERFRAGKLLAQRFDTERPIISLTVVRSLHIRAAITAPVLVEGDVVGLLTIGRTRPPEPGVAELFAPWDEELLKGVARLSGEALARARLSRQLSAAQTARWAAEEAARQHEEFLSVASHELRTPLTSVKANVQIALRRLGSAPVASEGSQQAHAVLDRADRQIDRLIRLVDDLVDASRIHSDRLELRRLRADLRDVVREAVEEQRHLTRPERLRLDLPDRAVFVDADPDRIEQVITNFLTNSLKYSPESAPVEVRVEVEPAAARVSVRDEGPGLAPDERERIWERFHRAEGVRVQSGAGIGLGLGLYISRDIVVRHGGTVAVESAPGKGSTFSFTLPLTDDSDAAKKLN